MFDLCLLNITFERCADFTKYTLFILFFCVHFIFVFIYYVLYYVCIYYFFKAFKVLKHPADVVIPIEIIK